MGFNFASPAIYGPVERDGASCFYYGRVCSHVCDVSLHDSVCWDGQVPVLRQPELKLCSEIGAKFCNL